MKNDNRDFIQRDQLLLPWSPGRTVSTARAAQLLGVSQTLILNMIKDGTLCGYKLRPHRKKSHYRIFRESIETHAMRMAEGYTWYGHR